MPMPMERLEAFFVEEGLKYRLEEDGHLLTGFATRSYLSPEGVRGMAVVVRLSEGGEYLEFTAPNLYSTADCQDRGPVCEVLLEIMLRTKMIRFEHDREDGEIRASIECPLEDGRLTRRQFRRMLEALPELIDRWDPVIRQTLRTGRIDLEAAAEAANCSAQTSELEPVAGSVDLAAERWSRCGLSATQSRPTGSA